MKELKINQEKVRGLKFSKLLYTTSNSLSTIIIKIIIYKYILNVYIINI